MLHKFSGNGCIAHIVCIVLITKDMGEWAFHYCTLSLLRQSSNLMYHWGNVFSWRTHCVIYPLNKLKIIANNYGVPIYILCIIWISNIRKEDTKTFFKRSFVLIGFYSLNMSILENDDVWFWLKIVLCKYHIFPTTNSMWYNFTQD